MRQNHGALPTREMLPNAIGVFHNGEEDSASKNLTRPEVAAAIFANALPRLREKFGGEEKRISIARR